VCTGEFDRLTTGVEYLDVGEFDGCPEMSGIDQNSEKRPGKNIVRKNVFIADFVHLTAPVFIGMMYACLSNC